MLTRTLLALITGSVLLLGCDEGVDDPRAFFEKNAADLQNVVLELKQSGIGRVQTLDYDAADKFWRSDEDAILHAKLKNFIEVNKIISIQVVRDRKPPITNEYVGAAFHVKTTHHYPGIEMVSFVHVRDGYDPNNFFRKSSCELLIQDWYLCNEEPA